MLLHANVTKTKLNELKYQRHHDSRPTLQPQFETDQLRQLRQTQETDDEELIAKLYIDIKENMALAFESESRASFHHFIVSENLIRLYEKVGRQRFTQVLSEYLKMTRRYVFTPQRLFYFF